MYDPNCINIINTLENIKTLDNIKRISYLNDDLKIHILSFLSPLYWLDIINYEKTIPVSSSVIVSNLSIPIRTLLFPLHNHSFYRQYFQRLYEDWERYAYFLIHHDIHTLFESFSSFMGHLLEFSEYHPHGCQIDSIQRYPSKHYNQYNHGLSEKYKFIVKEELEGWVEIVTRSFFKCIVEFP